MSLLVVLTVFLVPLVASAVAGWRPWVGWLHVAGGLALVGCGTWLAVTVLDSGPISFAGGLLRADALSAFWILAIGLITTLTAWYGTAFMRSELDRGRTTPGAARAYGVLVAAFIEAMLLAVSTDNLGLMWVAIESTTIASVFLVGHHRSRRSLEASWKYIMIGSVGVAVALLGTVLVYYAARHSTAAETALSWTSLTAGNVHLQSSTLRLAIGMVIVGFGTKAGLAPMHTWLPDSYGQAPTPVGALMAGVLSVALYAILRYRVIAEVSLGPNYTRGLLLAAGLLSLFVAASLLIAQRDYKRLLAYSSIENMGIMALGAAAGSTLAITAVLLHVIGHGLAKSALFLGSGELERTEGSTRIVDLTGLLRRSPRIAGLFAVGLVALVGFPPFSLFASEIGIVRGGFEAGLGLAMAVALVLLLVAVASIGAHTQRMLLGVQGPSRSRPRVDDAARRPLASWAPLVLALGICAVLGVTTWPIDRLLAAAAAIAVN
jgi:hydrogenase-4 component F